MEDRKSNSAQLARRATALRKTLFKFRLHPLRAKTQCSDSIWNVATELDSQDRTELLSILIGGFDSETESGVEEA